MDASRLQIQWHLRNNTAIFVRALHILDLDLLPDWSNISDSTFLSAPAKASTNTTSTAQSQPRNRIKSLEWALFHLFRLYSPIEAASRLSPSFPPATPIQSRDLRAGIYKWLAELKQSGELPRETVLRKTMLDECKGDKFEELVARFAMLVVRKTLAQDRGEASNRQVRQREHDIGRQKRSTTEGDRRHDPESLLPLILAHRVSLQHSLCKRQDLRDKATSYAQKLAQLRKDVASGLQDISQRPPAADDDNAEIILSATEHKSLSERINLAFASDRRWARYILEGAPASSTPASARDLPEWPFENPLPSTPQSAGTVMPSTDEATDAEDEEANQPMRQLQSLISQHQERIARLTAVRDSLISASKSKGQAGETPRLPTPHYSTETILERAAEPHTSASNIPSTRSRPRFTQHQDLIVTWKS
ncbi:uncharacterized protein A1O5_09940 [Cladophialophora psammophila CBS 110553]|uniref:HAUS augmin-like complex subunit 6 N-terminal domain-containing protein n=1 Tax=Cladophialophora psammophila CBS 110553 TaxID=1182543 RepID=W9WP18_9EURO|nr:uncharacterized protein A1O5_09940 [Cladophialophora psammophila CBS 110553]EXJ66745.1 hypothetical protein A1O5_09940 [Cladophialophora psammophila CBS 110553]